MAHLLRRRQKRQSPLHASVVVSSSPLLQRAAQEFRKEFGDPFPVWTPAAVGYLLSMIPGVKMTLPTLKRALFDEGGIDSTEHIVRLGMRVIKQSDQYSLGYSRRPRLRRELLEQIDKLAKSQDVPRRVLLDELTAEPERYKEAIADVIAKAVDQIEASKYEREKQA